MQKLRLCLLIVSVFFASEVLVFGQLQSNHQNATTTPIKYLVLIFDENNSFDHYFATDPVAANPAGEPPFYAQPDTPVVNGVTAELRSNNPNGVQPFRLDPADAITTDSTILIGSQHGRPPMNDPNINPQDQGVHVGTEVGAKEDTFVVYRGGVSDPLNSPPVWRYIANHCLRAPNVTAVEQFRKAVIDAEKPTVQKKP